MKAATAPQPSRSRTALLAALVVAAPLAMAGEACDAPPEAWQARSAVQELAQRNRWRLERLKVDDGCYEVRGRDAEGVRFKARIDPATLKVLALKRERRGHDDAGDARPDAR